MDVFTILQFPPEILSMITGLVVADEKSFFSLRTVSKFFYVLATYMEHTIYLELKEKRDKAIDAILDILNDESIGDIFGGFSIKIQQKIQYNCSGIYHGHICVSIDRIPVVTISDHTLKTGSMLNRLSWNWFIYSHEPTLLLPIRIKPGCKKDQETEDKLLSHFGGPIQPGSIQWEKLAPMLVYLLKDANLIQKLEFKIETSTEQDPNAKIYSASGSEMFQREGVDIEAFGRLYSYKYENKNYSP